jgi:hypothetical protein
VQYTYAALEPNVVQKTQHYIASYLHYMYISSTLLYILRSALHVQSAFAHARGRIFSAPSLVSLCSSIGPRREASEDKKDLSSA